MKVFAMWDTKAEQFGTPIFCETRGLALRGLSDACANQQSELCRHPEDYSLYELAEYDKASGRITPHERPIHLYSCVSVVAQLAGTRLSQGEVVNAVEAPKEVAKQ